MRDIDVEDRRRDEMSDTPYDDAKKRWMMIALYAIVFAAVSMAFRFNLIPFGHIWHSIIP